MTKASRPFTSSHLLPGRSRPSHDLPVHHAPGAPGRPRGAWAE